MKTRLLVVLLLVCGVALGFARGQQETATGGQPPAEEQVVKIGVLLPLTGRYADFGEQMKNGIELAVEHYAPNGVTLKGKQYRVQTILADSEGKLEVAVPAVQKLITVDKIHAATGFFYSSIFLSVMEELQRYKIPAVDTVGAATAIFKKIAEQKMDYIYQLSPTTDDMARSIAAATNHYIKPNRIALMSEDSDAGREINGYCIQWFKANAPGVEVVFDEYTDPETVDFTQELLKIKASKADAQFSLILGASSAPMLENRRDLRIEAWLCHFGGTVDAAGFRNDYKDLMEGMLINVRFWPGTYTAISTKMYNDYEAKYGRAPTTFAVQAYEGALVVIEAIKRAQSLESAAIQKQIDSGSFVGVRGELDFTDLSNGHRAPMQMAIAQVQAGELVPIWPLSLAKPGAFDASPKKPW